MEVKEMRTKLHEWRFPLGPFRTIEEVFHDMEANARCMGVKAAPELARILVQLSEKEEPLEEDLYQFLQIYAKYYSHALEEALRKELRSTGPPTLVELLGYTGSQRSVRHIRQTLDLDQAGDELLISVACALGELGGAEAGKMLLDLRGRKDLSQDVLHEVEIALANILHFEQASHVMVGGSLAHQHSNGKQSDFYTPEWQAKEQAADQAIAEGRVRTFDTMEDMLDFLDAQ